MSYTFEYTQSRDGKDWTHFSLSFATVELAAVAASDWMYVCAENGFYVAVRVVEARPMRRTATRHHNILSVATALGVGVGVAIATPFIMAIVACR